MIFSLIFCWIFLIGFDLKIEFWRAQNMFLIKILIAQFFKFSSWLGFP
jgi:hypothetical protein